MTIAARPVEFFTIVIVAVVVLLVGTITGRYVLRRLAVGLGLIAAAAVVILDGASPLS